MSFENRPFAEGLTKVTDEARARLIARIGEHDYALLYDRVSDRAQQPVFERLLAGSEFFAEMVARHCDWLVGALDDGSLLRATPDEPAEWDRILESMVGVSANEAEWMRLLRIFRNQQLLRVLWQDAAGISTIEAVFFQLSQLADCCIRFAVRCAQSALLPKFGEPMGGESNEVQSLVVLAMGKLGGQELNFSSDIDLIFAYPESGTTRGGRQCLENQAYFTRLGQMVIRLLDAVTEDGFVFRVDMRLRPYGDSGALVGSFNALELYYQEQGREWERYAMIKARPVTGHPAAQQSLMKMLNGFVYRRYTDFSVIAALREMKTMMRREVARLSIAQDLKRGAGGIREIEFIAQSLQLIHGGRMPELQCTPLLMALERLAGTGVLPQDQAALLADHYRLARRLEHAVQAMQDRQTQALPGEQQAREQLALLAGFADWAELEGQWALARKAVAASFNALIADPRDPTPSATASDGVVFSALDAAQLQAFGYQEPDVTWTTLAQFLDTAWVSSLQGEGRQRFETFLPILCEAAARERAPDLALTRALPFVRAVCRRSAYLVLLQENRHALAHLLTLVASSEWVAERLAARPELVDELLYEATLYSAPAREELHSLVRQQLLRIPEEDLEMQMNALSRIKDGVVLRVAASELSGTLPIMKVSDNLTFLAEIMVEQAVAVARADLIKRFGEPGGERAGFAVMAYGKLGGVELSYGSDLDLVFVFDGADGQTAGPKVIDNTLFYTRLAQRVVHVLSAQTASGRLYEIDLRLRPDGDSGLVATSLSALKRYQLESAWTWEHQALVRSRTVAGDAFLKQSLEALRREVLSLPRDSQSLAKEVCDMRGKMRAEYEAVSQPTAQTRLKLEAGGIVDIEFVVQYLTLAHAHEYPALTAWSDVIRLLETLEKLELVSAEAANTLSEAYLAYRGAIHRLALRGRVPETGEATDTHWKNSVIATTEVLLPGLQAR